jgi:exonuclease III
MTFLFWNVQGKEIELSSVVATLASRHRVEVILLGECLKPEDLLPSLNRESQFLLTSAADDQVAVYTRFSDRFLVVEDRQPRFTIWRLSLPGREEILLVTAHLSSKREREDADKTNECIKLAEAIRAVEQRAGHSKTLVVGDLNLNPFEDGAVWASGLNAVMTRRLAARETRTVQSSKYPFFYNPMWRFFGDPGDRPAGTYYQWRAVTRCYFWNIFDQVLVRPALMEAFDDRALRILDSDGSTSFLSGAGVPDRKRFSDHLPLTFALALDKGENHAWRALRSLALGPGTS